MNRAGTIGKNLKSEWDNFISTGSDQAFYVLYGHYHDYGIYIALQKGFSIEQAKDSINDLFLYVFEHRARLGHVKSHHNYLVTSFLRKLHRKGSFNNLESLSAYPDGLPDDALLPALEDSCFDASGDERLSRKLKDYIGKLSYSQAKMIYQKFYFGLSYEEIAASNEVSIKTAYNTVLQAISKLRNLIGAEKNKKLSLADFALVFIPLLVLLVDGVQKKFC